jgi:hypothetical protein
MLAELRAHALAREHAEVLRDLGLGREQREFLLVELLDLVHRRVSVFGDGFLRRLVILAAGERTSRGGHREKPPSAS